MDWAAPFSQKSALICLLKKKQFTLKNLLLTALAKFFLGINEKLLFEALTKRSKPQFSIPSSDDKLLKETSREMREEQTCKCEMCIS